MIFTDVWAQADFIYSYIEGIVRGYRNALLTSQNYGNLTQCENIDGLVLDNDIWVICSPS